MTQLFIGIGTPHPKGKHLGGPSVAFQLHDFEQVSVTAEALDAEGNPASGSLAWASSDDTVVSVTDNGDGSALITASPGAGGLGTATVSADFTDASDGDVHTGAFEVEVIAGDAVAVNIVPGTPEPKPTPVP